jgi:hypothetical protein
MDTGAGMGNETEDEWAWEDDRALQREEETHGDLLHLEGLKGGENMNEGKSWEWVRHVGREGARPAWWVLKCDDDVSVCASWVESVL